MICLIIPTECWQLSFTIVCVAQRFEHWLTAYSSNLWSQKPDLASWGLPFQPTSCSSTSADMHFISITHQPWQSCHSLSCHSLQIESALHCSTARCTARQYSTTGVIGGTAQRLLRCCRSFHLLAMPDAMKVASTDVRIRVAPAATTGAFTDSHYWQCVDVAQQCDCY